jgi:phage replication-related protein YjqB (UPF0714/DUF867 family)
MTVVTISRELGSRGTRIAEAVGNELDATCIDKEVLAEMARLAGVQVEVIVEAEEKLMSRAGMVSQEMRSLFSADPSRRNRPMNQEAFVERMTVVTISRELGSRGTRIAEAVGNELDATCIDKEVLAEMARLAGVQVEVIVEAEEKLMSRAGMVSQEMRSLFSADPSRRNISSPPIRAVLTGR